MAAGSSTTSSRRTRSRSSTSFVRRRAARAPPAAISHASACASHTACARIARVPRSLPWIAGRAATRAGARWRMQARARPCSTTSRGKGTLGRTSTAASTRQCSCASRRTSCGGCPRSSRTTRCTTCAARHVGAATMRRTMRHTMCDERAAAPHALLLTLRPQIGYVCRCEECTGGTAPAGDAPVGEALNGQPIGPTGRWAYKFDSEGGAVGGSRGIGLHADEVPPVYTSPVPASLPPGSRLGGTLSLASSALVVPTHVRRRALGGNQSKLLDRA
jgi:hypothetical protein